MPHRLDPRHIPRKDKEKDEGEQQGIVHHLQRLAVGKEQGNGDHDQPDPIGNPPKNDGDGKRKEQEIKDHPRNGQSNGFIRHLQRLGFHKKDAAKGNQKDGKEEGRGHDLDELHVGDLKFGIEIKILRIAKRGEHPAQVGGNILHDECKGHILFFAGGMENEIAQRQEGQKRHIVGDQHRADKGDID